MSINPTSLPDSVSSKMSEVSKSTVGKIWIRKTPEKSRFF